jgi:hypothetical protein
METKNNLITADDSTLPDKNLLWIVTLERMRKEVVVTWLEVLPGIFLAEENYEWIQDIRCSDQDSNRASPEYKSEAASLALTPATVGGAELQMGGQTTSDDSVSLQKSFWLLLCALFIVQFVISPRSFGNWFCFFHQFSKPSFNVVVTFL